MKFLLIVLFISYLTTSQEYFTEFPKIEYEKIFIEKNFNEDRDDEDGGVWIKFGDGLELRISAKHEIIRSYFDFYRDGELVQSFADKHPVTFNTLPDTIYTADFNNDGLFDIKIVVKNNSPSFAGKRKRKFYFIQNTDGTFDKFSYLDFFHEEERDLDGDGKWEIITRHSYLKQNTVYWVFDIFNFEDHKMVHKSKKFGYPRVTNFMTEEIKDTEDIDRAKWQMFSRSIPEYHHFELASEQEKK